MSTFYKIYSTVLAGVLIFAAGMLAAQILAVLL
jgi:hypothetical protein